MWCTAPVPCKYSYTCYRYAVHVYTEFYANCVDVAVSGTAVDAETFYAAATPVVTITGTLTLGLGSGSGL